MSDHASQKDTVDTLFKKLFPICRSLTGTGNRETFKILNEIASFDVHELPSGTEVFDWHVPDEWTIRDAYIADEAGNRIIDFADSNLHVASYSIPIDATMTLADLSSHLYSLPDQPTAIPYRTLFYNRDWAFCIKEEQRALIPADQNLRVVVDSDLAPGSMTYGDKILPGTSGQEFVFSSYCCHPSLGNDNLSGFVLLTMLLKELSSRTLKHTYRFILVPETIGTIAYLHENQDAMRAVTGAYVLTGVAGRGQYAYKQSLQSDALIDRVARRVIRANGITFDERAFDPHGSDERQYSSPGFRIPTGIITRDGYYDYTEYHTSLDDLDFISSDALLDTLDIYVKIVDELENRKPLLSLVSHGEPHLGPRGLYPTVGGAMHTSGSATVANELDAILWTLTLADGVNDRADIAERSKIDLELIDTVVRRLIDGGLLQEIGVDSSATQDR